MRHIEQEGGFCTIRLLCMFQGIHKKKLLFFHTCIDGCQFLCTLLGCNLLRMFQTQNMISAQQKNNQQQTNKQYGHCKTIAVHHIPDGKLIGIFGCLFDNKKGNLILIETGNTFI